jgi:DNA sulfur modification protein DndB
MGDWYYYITTLPFYEVARRVRPATELVAPANMNYWIQRSITPRRQRQIADYLISQKEHLFPGIVVGVYQGDPTWYEIDVGENSIFGTPGLDPRFKYSLGILELDGREKLYAIDGQHRVAGIKEALRRLRARKDEEAYERLANEDLSIVFVSADIDREGHLERVRRLFTTLNKQAKRVSDAEIVALDEDDTAAIVTRWLATRYDGLKREVPATNSRPGMGLIQMGTRNEIQPTNRHSVTTIVTLFTMIKRVFQPELAGLKQKYKGNRPEERELEQLFEEAVRMWDLLKESVPPLADVLGTDPKEERAGKYRSETGGHLLFRPVGQQAFAGALGVLRKRHVEMVPAISRLCDLPMELAEIPWRLVLWDPNTKSMVNRNKTLAEALFLYMLGEEPRTTGYDVGGKYRELHGEAEGDPVGLIPIRSIR